MPNGVSCLYFAGKNLIYGKKEGNLFKDGIGAIQTVRTADFFTKSAVNTSGAVTAAQDVKIPFLSKTAGVLKRFLYPLIVLSGIYNTIKSKDKAKTGAQQAGAIATMYTLETIAEKVLNKIDKKIMSSSAAKNNKKLRILCYIAKGAAFTVASITGYNIGNKKMGNIVDNMRAKKAAKEEIKKQKLAKITTDANLGESATKSAVFDEIEAILEQDS